MLDEFKSLEDQFSHYAPPADVLDDSAWADVQKKIHVVIPAGGQSKRLRSVTGPNFNKISTPLPNGDTLIEYNIRMYRDAGLSQFTLLIGHASETVIDRIGDGSKLGVSVSYSRDPEMPVGTGGALRLALESGALGEEKYLIVHNGGDVFIGYPGNLPRELASHHMGFERHGSVATILSAPFSLVQGSTLKIVNSFVEKIMYESYVPVPYHTAATMFSPSVFPLFRTLFPIGKKMEFERTLFPYLAEHRMLTAMKVDNQYFIPVKNEKQWEQLMDIFST